jgi:hypothetical protein
LQQTNLAIVSANIEELIKQAAEEGGWPPEVWQTTFSVTLARLVAEECMMICGAIAGACDITRPNDKFGEGAEHAKRLIAKHFGIDVS